MSNGSVQSVSGAWSSDNESVATVDGQGRVTPNANGRTLIRLASGTIQGTREIRVVPNYQGRWVGQAQIIACSATGLYVREATCGTTFPNGRLLTVGLTLTQATRDIVSGVFTRSPVQSASFTVPIEADGAITFTAPIVIASPPPSGVTLSGVALTGSWRTNSLTNGLIVGGMNEHWLSTDEVAGSGEMRLATELRNMSRVP
jgi:Bacterial Ig-like domain (group 2)